MSIILQMNWQDDVRHQFIGQGETTFRVRRVPVRHNIRPFEMKGMKWQSTTHPNWELVAWITLEFLKNVAYGVI